MAYELWNMRTGNALGDFLSEAEALAAVRKLVERHGRSYAEKLLLGHEDAHGRSRPIAQGQELASRALAAAGDSVLTPT
jgi:hypothetical protein